MFQNALGQGMIGRFFLWEMYSRLSLRNVEKSLN